MTGLCMLVCAEVLKVPEVVSRWPTLSLSTIQIDVLQGQAGCCASSGQ